MRRGASLQFALLALLVACSDAPEIEPSSLSATSENGLFHVTAVSSLDPIAVNRIHEWTLRVQDADGEPVEDARIVIYGGMPEHQHGLPTSPEVTRRVGNGEYLVEGMKFSMPGYWEITLTIWAGGVTDRVTLRLILE